MVIKLKVLREFALEIGVAIISFREWRRHRRAFIRQGRLFQDELEREFEELQQQIQDLENADELERAFMARHGCPFCVEHVESHRSDTVSHTRSNCDFEPLLNSQAKPTFAARKIKKSVSVPIQLSSSSSKESSTNADTPTTDATPRDGKSERTPENRERCVAYRS